MEIEDSGDLIYYTYYMLDWKKVKQSPSSTRCLNCSKMMLSVEVVRDKKGLQFEGVVCHDCKTLLWFRKN